jgi:hypothetical protein
MVSKTQDFAHDFPGTAINPVIFTVSGSPTVADHEALLKETDGLVVIDKYDLTNSYLFHKVEIEPKLIFAWSVDRDENNKVGFIKKDTYLIFRVVKDGAVTDHTITYIGTEHRWWRMRESFGTLYFDTSPNGKDWNNQYNIPTPFNVSVITIHYKTQVPSDSGWGFGAEGGPQ